MSNSYQRAILIGIMRMVAQNPHIAVKSLEMTPAEATKPGALESYTVTRESTDRSDFNAEEWREVDEFMHVSKLLQMTPQEVAEIVKVSKDRIIFPHILHIKCLSLVLINVSLTEICKF